MQVERAVRRLPQVETMREQQIAIAVPPPGQPPGFFEAIPDTRAWGRHEALFFREFVDDLTQPIERDDRRN